MAQGLVSMMGTVIDTLIICTMTGLSIVITDTWNIGLDGVDVTTKAFQIGLPFRTGVVLPFNVMSGIFCIYHDPWMELLQRKCLESLKYNEPWILQRADPYVYRHGRLVLFYGVGTGV